MKEKLILLWVAIFILLSISACASETKHPFPDGLPQQEIVFIPDFDHGGIVTDSLGFIDADGNQRQEYAVKYDTGYKSNFGVKLFSQNVVSPRWSKTGDMLAFVTQDRFTGLRMVDSQGNMYGKKCQDFTAIGSSFDEQNNIFGILGTPSGLYFQHQNKLISRYDLISCQSRSEFTLPIPSSDYYISRINEASNGLLVAAYHEFGEEVDKIIVHDPNTKKYKVFSGYHPSLTDDGVLLAYYSEHGILVIRDIATTDVEKELVDAFLGCLSTRCESLFSMPGWSPDKKWLVYNTLDGEIFKINIETKENIYLTHGWEPDWR